MDGGGCCENGGGVVDIVALLPNTPPGGIEGIPKVDGCAFPEGFPILKPDVGAEAVDELTIGKPEEGTEGNPTEAVDDDDEAAEVLLEKNPKPEFTSAGFSIGVPDNTELVNGAPKVEDPFTSANNEEEVFEDAVDIAEEADDDDVVVAELPDPNMKPKPLELAEPTAELIGATEMIGAEVDNEDEEEDEEEAARPAPLELEGREADDDARLKPEGPLDEENQEEEEELDPNKGCLISVVVELFVAEASLDVVDVVNEKAADPKILPVPPAEPPNIALKPPPGKGAALVVGFEFEFSSSSTQSL